MHRAAAGQIDDEVAGFGRHGNARVGVVEPDRVTGHANVLQRRAKIAADRGFFSGHALDGEEAHEAVGGGFDIDGHAGFLCRAC